MHSTIAKRRLCAGMGQLTAILVLLASASPTLAQPLYARDLSPVAGLFGFPVMREASVLPAAGFSAGLVASAANNYSADSEADESVNFDVETHRLAWRASLGLGAGFELTAEVPWLQHDGGRMDQLIETWHGWFNLPDGNREDVPRDLVDVRFQSGDANLLLQDSVSGLGDVSVALTRRLWRGEDAVVSTTLGAKFATGDEDDLLGSGSHDYYLAVNASAGHRGKSPLRWHGQLGYLRAGSADLLGSLQEQDLWFAGLSMDWQLSQTISLLLQVDSHAAVADTALTQLGDTSVQLTAGGRWRFARGWSMELSFSEDIAVNTAPDFVLQLGLRYRPQR
ncbi:MAG: DUF3187 family protein [Pseudomonadota bacterium]